MSFFTSSTINSILQENFNKNKEFDYSIMEDSPTIQRFTSVLDYLISVEINLSFIATEDIEFLLQEVKLKNNAIWEKISNEILTCLNNFGIYDKELIRQVFF